MRISTFFTDQERLALNSTTRIVLSTRISHRKFNIIALVPDSVGVNEMYTF